MLVISTNAVLTRPPERDPDVPCIGWRNVAVFGAVAASSAAEGYPATQLTNPATHLYWKAVDTAEQYLTVTIGDAEDLDYVGIAGHNFGSAGIAVSVEGFIDGVWTEIVQEVIPAGDDPLLLRFAAMTLPQVRVRLQTGGAAARASVLYAGKLLDLERKVYVGHTPMPFARKSNVSNGKSERGAFLGRIVLGEWRESVVPLSLISPDWYRANMDEFLAAAKEQPFFFAWRPQSYPREVGFCWLMEDPAPVPTGPSNRLAFDLKVSGVA